MAKTKFICCDCLQEMPKEGGKWVEEKSFQQNKIDSIKRKAEKQKRQPSTLIISGEKNYWKCENHIGVRTKTKKSVERRRKAIKKASQEKEKTEQRLDNLEEKVSQHDQQFSTVNKVLAYNVTKTQEVSKEVQNLANPSEEDTIKKAQLYRDAHLKKKYGNKWLKHVRDLKKYKKTKSKKISSGFSNLLYNDWDKQQIQKAKSIEQIDNLDQWNIWEPKTRKARIIYVTLPSVFFFVIFSIWKWDLIKKYKDWYNSPVVLDGEEEDWDRLEEEEQKENI